MNFKKILADDELEALLQPHLRLFLSVDVVDSTAFKHETSKHKGAKPWLKFIHGFFTGFPGIFFDHFRDVKSKNGNETSLRRPYLWKACGDELIFSVPLQHPAHLRLYLKAFLHALQDTKTWTLGQNALPIKFKGTAWLAGFPVFNSAVPLESITPISADSEHFDFVGPLIDIGFRLAKYATPRKLVVSADIAWLVTHSGDTAGLNFFYDGREKLKGVLNGVAYPVFWIDCQDAPAAPQSLEGLEDKLLDRDACKPTVVSALAKSFLDSVPESIPKPFFHGLEDIEPDFKPPPGFKPKLKAAQAELRRIYMPNLSEPDEDPKKQSKSDTKKFQAFMEDLNNPTSLVKKSARKRRS